MGYDFYFYAFTVLPMRLPLTVRFNIPCMVNFSHSFIESASAREPIILKDPTSIFSTVESTVRLY